ncbi:MULTISPECIES: prohead protease/major capsid protein fusion protein [unclassified Rhizobium]|uniref:prohead protease/major capsid protein fusion protein n=1 Tax=unclassified Rhizobium TaxID=2613769 RepID=UPI0027D41A6D|nr:MULTISPECIES: prohead protease/major capsid protein fusion protein [unclassified Rhizobium]MDQ4407021.1 hypothetical protein [Rhizobium sp. AN63]
MPEIIDAMQTRADRKLSSFNADARTVDIVLATESEVKRRSWEDGLYIEVLSVTRTAIDAGRLDALPLLDQHDAYSGLAARLGSVLAGSLRIEGGSAIVTAKISRNAGGEALFRDLEDGHVLGASVGYRIDAFEKKDAPSGGLPTIRATRWTPLELSIVSIPADPAATTRAHETERTTEMPQQPSENQQQQRQAPTNIIHERTRVKELRGLAKMAEVEDTLLERAIDEGMTVEQFRNAVLEQMVAREEQSPTFPHSPTHMDSRMDAQETTRRMVANAILHRHGLTEKLEDGARQFREMTPVDLARELLRQRGENAYGGSSSIIQRALHTNSDFPAILGDVARQTIMASYRRPNNTFQLIAHKNVVTDLREVKVIDIGGAPDLKLVLEGGEYTSGTISEAAEGFTMAKYGRKFGVTEELLINDQLGGVMKAVAEWGRKVAKLEGDLVWAAIINNLLKLKDGKPIFDPAHNNVAATGTALTKENLIKARLAFRRQKDIDGEPTDISPKYLFTGSALEIDAQSLIAAAHVPTTVTDAIPQAIKSMVPIYEPRLDKIPTNAWFLFAGEEDTLGRGLQYAYLAGHEAPSITERIGFDVDGFEFKIKQYFGVGVTDYRFAYQNPGVAPL